MSSNFYEEYWKISDEWSPSQGGLDIVENKIISNSLKPGMNVLDYGCGNGKRYAKRIIFDYGINYFGFDVSELAIQQGKEIGLNIQILNKYGIANLENDSMDAAICFEVFEHLQIPDLSANEIFRCLKPGGILLTSVPNIGYFTNRLEFFLTGTLIPGGSPLSGRKTPWNDPHIRFFNFILFRLFLQKVGFVDLTFHPQKFSFINLPFLYKKIGLHKPLKILSKPFAWLGTMFPSLFSGRILATAKKPYCY